MTGPIEDFLKKLRAELAVSVEVDEPSNPQGEWWIDLKMDGLRTSVVWTGALGFGVFTTDVEYGERPQEIYRNSSEASARILQLAANWRRDAQIHALGLKEVRHLVGITQGSVAEALGADQARVSRIEKGGDMKLSTLMDYISAIGGTVELKVHFPSFEAPIHLLDTGQKTERRQRAA